MFLVRTQLEVSIFFYSKMSIKSKGLRKNIISQNVYDASIGNAVMKMRYIYGLVLCMFQNKKPKELHCADFNLHLEKGLDVFRGTIIWRPSCSAYGCIVFLIRKGSRRLSISMYIFMSRLLKTSLNLIENVGRKHTL